MQDKSSEKQKKLSVTTVTFIMLVTLAVLVVWLCIMLILRTSNKVSEWICNTFVNAYIDVAGRFYSVVNFNVFEVLATLSVIAVIATIIASIVLFAKGKKVWSRRLILGLAIIAVWTGNLYMFTAGFAYNRDPAPIPVYEEEIDTELAKDIYIAMTKDFNECVEQLGKYPDGRAICPYTDRQIREKVRGAYQRLVTDDYYYDYTAKGKPIISSGIMASFSISGITFTPTVEGGYNKDMPMSQKPSTIAHELAHTKGVMREDEANALAAYVLLNSGDPYLKYSFYIDNMNDIKSFVIYNADYEEIAKEYPLDKAYIEENNYCYKWWNDRGMLNKIGNFFNNLYLKLSGEEDGTGSYIETPDIGDSGEVDDDGEPIYIIVNYTKIQRTIADYYINNLKSA